MAHSEADGVVAHVDILVRFANVLVADAVQREPAVLRADHIEVLLELVIEVGHMRGCPGLQANQRLAMHRVKPVVELRQRDLQVEEEVRKVHAEHRNG